MVPNTVIDLTGGAGAIHHPPSTIQSAFRHPSSHLRVRGNPETLFCMSYITHEVNNCRIIRELKSDRAAVSIILIPLLKQPLCCLRTYIYHSAHSQVSSSKRSVLSTPNCLTLSPYQPDILNCRVRCGSVRRKSPNLASSRPQLSSS